MQFDALLPTITQLVSDPVADSADSELLARVERGLAPTYEVERELGRGGMGIVYRARDTRLKRIVAIKLLPPELAFRSEIRSRFLREAEMAAQLSHPNIVPIYSVDERDGLVFFVMACVDGDNLARRMADRGPLPVAEVRRTMREVASALAFAHARKFIHRDIKPDNVLLDRDDGRAIVTDFGIARAVGDAQSTRLTATGMAIGTPAYMSPEQCAGDREIDGRADLYALGVLGYQMLAGRLPFEGNSTPAILVKQLSERPLPIVERRPDTPPDLAAIIMRLLEKEPSARFATADELLAALDGRISAGWAGAPTAAATGAATLVRNTAAPARSVAAPASAPAVPPPSDLVARWYAPAVVKFRKGLAPFFSFAVVAVLLNLFTNVDLTFVPAFWSIGIAMQYAKLWQAGYDWRDVLKQRRETLFADYLTSQFDDFQGLWDPRKREEARQRALLRAQTGEGDGLFSAGDALVQAGASPRAVGTTDVQRFGAWYDAVREASADVGEINRMIEGLPKGERSLAADLAPAASRMVDVVRREAGVLADLDRNPAPAVDVTPIDREIAMLEAQANPLEAGSEERVRRLARLRRERRLAVAEQDRRARAQDKLERARAGLRSIRYDLVKLRSGPAGSTGLVTQLTERAQELAKDVDAVLAASNSVR